MSGRDWKSTLLLPRTAFPMKADLPRREPARLARWMDGDLYDRIRAARAGAPRFLLHDGPPFANGRIHVGTAMNKILKDLVVRTKTLEGLDAPYVPGWDCHGLPIERGVDKELGPKKRGMTDVAIRDVCRASAEKWIAVQMADFKRLGILGAWKAPYRTMDFSYEARIARDFGRFVERGLVSFGFKSVLWCVYDRTALAEAEIEYEDKTDWSIYVAMPLEESSSKAAWTGAPEVAATRRLYALIWTTTPWTLPANRAISLGPKIEYVLLKRKSEPDAAYLVAEELVPQVTAALGWTDASPLARSKRSGAALVESRAPLRYVRPFSTDPRDNFGFLLGEHVSTTDGTGLVHTAPGHGRDDYEVVKRAGFDVDDAALCPVDEGGHYDVNAPDFLRGKRVVTPRTPADDANEAVIAALARDFAEAQEFTGQAGRDRSGSLLLGKSRAPHSYPHCWRCKNPVIFRATHQWFIDLGALREKAMTEIRERVRWIPGYSENRIGAMVDNRLEWTISRQRRWGSPITFLKCVDCEKQGRVSHFPRVEGGGNEKEKTEREEFFERVRETFRQHGANAWYDEAFPPSYFLRKSSSDAAPAGPSARCAKCGGSNFEKLKDILDVWFDSGVSHDAVLRSGDYGLENPYEARPPVPVMYLEGHDQHRGWFQSSLLTSVALTGRAPYDTVLTHGFVVAGDGRKMSKSLGNTIELPDLLKSEGADVIRFWVASMDYTNDDPLSKEILARTAEAYRKVRNTARFLLSNLFDFDPSRDALGADRLEPLECWAIDAAAQFASDVRAAYGRYEFHVGVRHLLDFVTLDVSAFWCDVRKEALYVLAANDRVRRSAQTAAWKMVEAIALALSPVCPFTAEEIWEAIPGRTSDPASLFVQRWSDLRLEEISSNEREAWGKVLALRSEFVQSLAPLRREGGVGGAGQAAAVVGKSDDIDRALALLHLSEERLADVFGTSYVVREPGANGAFARAAEGKKCPRCWQVRRDVEPGDDGICARCRGVVGG